VVVIYEAQKIRLARGITYFHPLITDIFTVMVKGTVCDSRQLKVLHSFPVRYFPCKTISKQ
jgi:hypothetical protein